MAELTKPVPQNQGQQYKISDAVITADRLGDLEIEVTQRIAELNIYEHIEKPYLTGLLMLIDDGGIFSSIKFKGTERFSFKVSSVEEGVNVSFEHTFLMKEIVKEQKTNEKNVVYLISLIDEHAFKDTALKVSKSYTGKLERIATGIIISELDKDVDVSYSREASVQAPIRVIVPYLSPLTAAKWLLNRASTVNGAPYYIYASMYDDNIRIGDAETMLAQEAFNSRIPYLYSPAATNSTVDLGEDKKAFVVEDLRTENLEETMKMLFDGAVGANVTTQDISGSNKLPVHFSIRETLKRLKDGGVIPAGGEQQVYDPEYLFDDDANNPVYLDDKESRYFHVITSTGTYGNQRSYNGVYTPAESKQRIQSISVKSMLERNRIDIQVPGTGIFLRKVTVGDTIAVNFLKSDVNLDNPDEAEKYDQLRSGKYMIYATRHTFKGTKHTVSMTITRINTQKNFL